MRAIDLREAFIAFKRDFGTDKAREVVVEHGGAPGHGESIPFGSVPDGSVADFAEAIGANLKTIADHGELTGRRDDLPESLEASDPKFQSFHDQAWGKFNRRGQQ